MLLRMQSGQTIEGYPATSHGAWAFGRAISGDKGYSIMTHN